MAGNLKEGTKIRSEDALWEPLSGLYRQEGDSVTGLVCMLGIC